MRRSVDAILPQLDAANGELIVVDASGLPAPDFANAANVRWLSMPGLASYDLRHAAYPLARAPIVAITEDHCAPRQDWLATLIEEHELDPDAVGIFGLVDNGSRDKVVDWGLFSAGYLAWAPPSPAVRGAPGHANLSFKTWIFKAVPPVDDQVLEFRYVVALREAGYRVVGTDRTLVTHYQSAGFKSAATLMFHNGRSIAGLRRQRMTSRDWLRALTPVPLALYRTVRTLKTAADKPDIETAGAAQCGVHRPFQSRAHDR